MTYTRTRGGAMPVALCLNLRAGLNGGLAACHGHAERAVVRFRHPGESKPRQAEIGRMPRALGRAGR